MTYGVDLFGRLIEDPSSACRPGLPEQIACVKRELKLRRSVYPRWVAQGRMSQAKADLELAALEAVEVTLVGLWGGGREAGGAREPVLFAVPVAGNGAADEA